MPVFILFLNKQGGESYSFVKNRVISSSRIWHKNISLSFLFFFFSTLLSQTFKKKKLIFILCHLEQMLFLFFSYPDNILIKYLHTAPWELDLYFNYIFLYFFILLLLTLACGNIAHGCKTPACLNSDFWYQPINELNMNSTDSQKQWNVNLLYKIII